MHGLNVGGVVLCGGLSRRMGTSKAWLACGSEYLLQRMVRIVSTVVQPVVVASRPGQSLPPLPDDVLLAHDAVDDAGPLAGMDAGFRAVADRCDAVFVTSCDHPLLKPSVVERLIEWLGDDSAVVPSHERRLYPLTAVYRLDTHSFLTELLARRCLRVRDFARACGARIVAASDLSDVDPDLDSLRNVNDPDTYDLVLRALDQ